MHKSPFCLGGIAVAFMSLGAVAQNPDRGYDATLRLDQAPFGVFSMDAYTNGQQTILYTGDFRSGNSVWKVVNGQQPVLVASGFGSGSLSIGDLVVDRQRHLIYVHDASHGAIYEIDPKISPTAIRAIASNPEWVTAFGNGGIDINPADGMLYLLTPGNSSTGGGIYSIDLASGVFQVTQELANVAALFQGVGRDVRPDIIRFDCDGTLWGSARDQGDLTNRPSILYRLRPPFAAIAQIEQVMVDPNVGTVADLECDPITRDLFLAATERRAVLRFNTDWYEHDQTVSTIEVANMFNRRVQGIALGVHWSERGGHSLFVGLNDSSHFDRLALPSDVYEIGPFFVTDDVVGKRCASSSDKVAQMRGVLPGMVAFSLSPDPQMERLFILGKTNESVDVLPGAYSLAKKPFNQYFETDFAGIAVGFGSGDCGRGDLIFTPWLYVDPIDAYPQPMTNEVYRVYMRDETDGYVHEVDHELLATSMPPCLHYRPEPLDNGAKFFYDDERGAMAIGPDQALWILDKDHTTNQLGVHRLFRENWTGKTLIQVEAVGANDLNNNTASGFWRITHNLGAPSDRGASIRDVTFSFRNSSNPLHSQTRFDTDQPGMADYFDAGNNAAPGCRGTYRNNSEVETGLVYDISNTTPRTPCASGANTGWIGTDPVGPGHFRTLQFRFSFGEFANETFEFDADTDFGPGPTGGDMAGMVVTVRLWNGARFTGELIADVAKPLRSFVRFTQQLTLDDYTPNPAVVLGANEEVDGVKVSYIGDIYALVVDKTVPESKLMEFDPVHGTLTPLRTMPERVNDFTFYEVLDRGPIQQVRPGPRYFLFATSEGKILKWNPANNEETVLADGFRFPVTTLEFDEPWHGGLPSSLLVMTGVDNPRLGEIFEIGPFDSQGDFLQAQDVVSLLPQGVRAAGSFVPFLRVEGQPQGGQLRNFVVKWVDPDGFGIGGTAGTLVLLFGGPTTYPGTIYIPGMYIPFSAFPVAALSAIARDPSGISTTPGAAEALFQLRAPPVVRGDFVLQALILDTTLGSSLGNTWTLTNGLRLEF